MGWSAGSEIVNGIIDAVQSEVPDEATRVRIYKKVLVPFDQTDWDTQYESKGRDPAFDRALREHDASLFDEEE